MKTGGHGFLTPKVLLMIVVAFAVNAALVSGKI
jgi:hypothetical protein